MKVLAKFDEIPSMILEVIKETKRYGHVHSELQREITPVVLAPSPYFLLVVFALYI